MQLAQALAQDADPTDAGVAARLYSLALADASVLANWRWNLGALILLPEARSPEMAEFQGYRRALRSHYVDMSRALTARTGSEEVNDQVLRLVVSIINQRWDDEVTSETPRQLARSGMRICGWVGPLDEVEVKSERLLTELSERDVVGGAFDSVKAV